MKTHQDEEQVYLVRPKRHGEKNKGRGKNSDPRMRGSETRVVREVEDDESGLAEKSFDDEVDLGPEPDCVSLSD